MGSKTGNARRVNAEKNVNKSLGKQSRDVKIAGSIQRRNKCAENSLQLFKVWTKNEICDKNELDVRQNTIDVRGITMRAGRNHRKTVVQKEKTKPCFVRLEKVRPESQQSEQTPVNKKLIGPLKKRPLNTQSKGISETALNTPTAVAKNVQERQLQTSSKHQERLLKITPNNAIKKLQQNTASPSVKRFQQTLQNTPSLSVKKVQKTSKNTPSPSVKKLHETPLNTPSPSLKKLQTPLNTPSPSWKKFKHTPQNSPSPTGKSSQQTSQGQQSQKKGPAHLLKASISTAKKVRPSPTTVASTRTRRAPKPNPKYSNADLITPKATKAKRIKGLLAVQDDELEDSDSAEDFYNALDETSNGSDTNDGDAFVVEEDSSDDFSDSEKMKPKRGFKSAPVVASNVTSYGPRRGRPKKVLTPHSIVKSTVESKKLVLPTVASQRVMSSSVLHLQQARKRKLEELDDVEPVESIIARNKRLNIALYDANDARTLPTLKNDTSKVVRQIARPKNQSPTPSSVMVQRRPMAGPNSAKLNQVSTIKEAPQKETNKSPQQKRVPAAATNALDTADSASTQDDFETMPTFTIVNIHDIINKKGDCLVQKKDDDEMGTTSPNNGNRVNRRKTGHTTILSEKIDPVKLRNPLPRTPFPPKKSATTILNSTQAPRAEPKLKPRLSIQSPENKQVKKTSTPQIPEKPAPRILNSVVAKRTLPVKPILSKMDDDIDFESNDDPIEKTQMVKENVGANKLLPMKPTQPRKLPPEKVFVQRQGNKLIKKITCFETWYVINIPEKQEPVVKNSLEIPLISLSNATNIIKLPSSSWGSKVTLYKLSSQMMGKSHLIPYTGDLTDHSIPEEDREKYQPSCVMFRRLTMEKSKTRMPYDRAVIFKMKTFFTNIDGKNVRLIGAPSTIKSFADIEILLELIDELDLVHEFVEPASTV